MESKVKNLVWERGIALCYDHLILMVFATVALLPTLVSIKAVIQTPEELWALLLSSIYTIPAVVLIFIVVIVYEPFFTYKYGWTIGKKICRLKVVDAQGKQLMLQMSFLRFFLKSFCMSVPYANFLILIFCYVRLRNGKKAFWDEWIHTNVVIDQGSTSLN